AAETVQLPQFPPGSDHRGGGFGWQRTSTATILEELLFLLGLRSTGQSGSQRHHQTLRSAVNRLHDEHAVLPAKKLSTESFATTGTMASSFSAPFVFNRLHQNAVYLGNPLACF